jgi:hypothetical protein
MCRISGKFKIHKYLSIQKYLKKDEEALNANFSTLRVDG